MTTPAWNGTCTSVYGDRSWESQRKLTYITYSDTAIECLLTIRELLKLPYRQTEGFGRSLIGLLDADVTIPDYSSLAKRAATLDATLDVANKRAPSTSWSTAPA